ncbi:MAG TPA: hypothetical protein VHZ04_03660 [Candidatus Paceibacterota bacterium]|nr:hypothetical protein [Candidatus Paceibacterota bacterium]
MGRKGRAVPSVKEGRRFGGSAEPRVPQAQARCGPSSEVPSASAQ